MRKTAEISALGQKGAGGEDGIRFASRLLEGLGLRDDAVTQFVTQKLPPPPPFPEAVLAELVAHGRATLLVMPDGSVEHVAESLPYQGIAFRDDLGFSVQTGPERLENMPTFLCGFCAGDAS